MPPALQFYFDTYCLDMSNEQLWRGSQALHLTPKAVQVLHLLLTHAGQLVTKQQLFQAVWPDTTVSDGVLTNCIGELRQALGDPVQAPHFIQTVHRRGYRFLAPVSEGGLPAPGEAAPLLPQPQHGSLGAPSAIATGPLVGRETELVCLRRWLEQARQGNRRVVFVSGEAGMGKTTLVEAFLASIGGGPAVWVAWGQCLAHYGAGEAYLPVLDAMGRLGRAVGRTPLQAVLEQYAPSWLAQLPVLRSVVEGERRTPEVGASQERMLRELAEALEALTAGQTLVLVLEDLQWSDHATLDLLAWLARRREQARLLVVGTYRPVEVIVQGHPLRAVVQELTQHRQGLELRLEGLSEAAVAAYLAAHLPGHPVPSDLAGVLHRRTHGHPLFMAEMVEAWLREGLLCQVEGQWTVPDGLARLETGIPASVRQLIERQLEGLSPEAYRVMEAASVIGMTVATAAIAAGLDTAVEGVEEACEALVRQGQFLRAHGVEERPDGTMAGCYTFRHPLHQQVIYDRLPIGRRLQLHGRIGAYLEAGYRDGAGEHAAELAMHFDRGRDIPRALQYIQEAAANARRRYASAEAIAHLTRGLDLLAFLPEGSERIQQELALQMALGPALMVAKGYAAPEVGRAYGRARELCRQVDQTPPLFSVVLGLYGFYLARGDLAMAQELAEQLVHLAQEEYDPDRLVRAHTALGKSLADRGELSRALAEFRHSIRFYDPQCCHSQAFYMWGLSYGAVVLWMRGYPDQARQQSQAALALTQEQHPFDVARALLDAAVLQQCCRDASTVQARAEAAVALARRHALPQPEARGTVLRGWALVEQGQGEEGLAQMCHGLDALQAIDAELNRPYLLALFAAAQAAMGQLKAALTTVAKALTLIEQTDMRSCEAELHRLQGDLLLKQAGGRTALSNRAARTGAKTAVVDAAQRCFQLALAVARRQQAKSWELRAATSLARLLRQQGKRGEARAVLAPVYHWFTEGFDTADLQDARALLEELA